jgi:cytoskeleton protein RodZ
VVVPAAPPPPPIRISSKQDAWVDVRQADGKSVFTGTVRANSPTDVKGTPPFSVTVGNANQVTLEFEGKTVDLKPVTTSPNNIAKVQLP